MLHSWRLAVCDDASSIYTGLAVVAMIQGLRRHHSRGPKRSLVLDKLDLLT